MTIMKLLYIGVCKENLEKYYPSYIKGEFFKGYLHLLARIYARLDRMEETRAYAAEALKIDPKFSVKKWRENPRLSRIKDQKVLDSSAEMMRKAGLPD